MEACRMEFSGRLLKRGFWLYVWDIREQGRRHVYVGRTGDTSSPFASSPFRRIGQHLDPRVNAKGNALGRQLRRAGLEPELCTFEMVAIGPLFDEQKTMEEHRPFRDQTAALEAALAAELKRRGYDVLGTHPRPQAVNAELFEQIIEKVQRWFPPRLRVVEEFEEFDPVALAGTTSASSLLIEERGER